MPGLGLPGPPIFLGTNVSPRYFCSCHLHGEVWPDGYSGQAPGQEASSIFRLVLSASFSPFKMPVKVIFLVTLSAILLNLTGKVPAYMCLFSSTFNWYYFIISFLLPAFIEHCQIGPCAQLLSHVQLFATPWTVARQAPLSMEFSRQKYWDGLHWLLQGTFLNQRQNPSSSCKFLVTDLQ